MFKKYSSILAILVIFAMVLSACKTTATPEVAEPAAEEPVAEESSSLAVGIVLPTKDDPVIAAFVFFVLGGIIMMLFVRKEAG